VSIGDTAAARLQPPHADAYAEARSHIERALIIELNDRGVPAPSMGAEAPGGIPVDVSYPGSRLAVGMPSLTPQDREDLEAAGWQVVDPTPDAIAAALAGTTSEGTG
jgi:hypothetical protein